MCSDAIILSHSEAAWLKIQYRREEKNLEGFLKLNREIDQKKISEKVSVKKYQNFLLAMISSLIWAIFDFEPAQEDL